MAISYLIRLARPSRGRCNGIALPDCSVARTGSDGDTVRPRAFAVLRLSRNSNLVGCGTGKLVGLAPSEYDRHTCRLVHREHTVLRYAPATTRWTLSRRCDVCGCLIYIWRARPIGPMAAKSAVPSDAVPSGKVIEWRIGPRWRRECIAQRRSGQGHERECSQQAEPVSCASRKLTESMQCTSGLIS